MWYQNAYRRMVVDMHIPDWDERFLSQFDPDTFVGMLRKLKHNLLSSTLNHMSESSTTLQR